MANSMKAIFEEGREMVRTGRAQNARQCPYHHREQIECWRAGFHIAMEELSAKTKAEEKAKAEAPPQVKHVGLTPEDLKFIDSQKFTKEEIAEAAGKKPKKSGKKKASKGAAK